MTGSNLLAGFTVWYAICIIGNIIAIIICGVLADKKGRSVGGWIFGGIMLGWIGVFILYLLSDVNYYRSSWVKHGSLLQNKSQNGNQNSGTPTQNYTYTTAKNTEKYTCASCGEKIDTDQCPYCGHHRNSK